MSQSYEDSVATMEEVFDNKFESIRIDEDTRKGSTYDVIQLVTDCDKKHSSQIYNRLPEECRTNCVTLRINGKGQPTPVADAKSLILIIWELPGKKAREFRMQCADYICRVLGGDPSLVREMELRARHVPEEQRDFFMQGVQVPDVDLLELQERRLVAKRRIDLEFKERERALVEQDERIKRMRKENFEALLQIIPPDEMDERDRVNMADMRRRFLAQQERAEIAGLIESSASSSIFAPKKQEEIGIPVISRKYGLKYPDAQVGNIGKLMKKLFIARHGKDPPKRRVIFQGRPCDEFAYWEADEDLMVAAITRHATNASEELLAEANQLIGSLIR
jgi:hypothetical protein